MPIRPNQLVNFFDLPEIPTGYELLPNFGIVIPLNRDVTNIVSCPSFERESVNGWSVTGSSSISFNNSAPFSGASCLDVALTGSGGIFHGSSASLTLTAGATYVVQMRIRTVAGGIPYSFYIATNGGVPLNPIVRFKTIGGFWQRVWFIYKETTTVDRRLYIVSDGLLAQSRTFFIDAVMIEEIPSGELIVPTTYFDGDSLGITPGEFPPAFYWTGKPHESTSVMSLHTRAGGRLVNFRDLGMQISAVNGLGIPIPQHSTIPYGQLDGSAYQRTQKQARTFSIAGRVTGRSALQKEMLLGALSGELDSDSSARRERIVLKYQPMDEVENPTGNELTIVATYQGGMEGQSSNLNSDSFIATFEQHSPNILGRSEGFTYFTESNEPVTNANNLIRRLPDGSWASMSTGTSGGVPQVRVIAVHPNGTVYVGGGFANAGSSGADFAAIYNPATDTFSVVKSATAFNNDVYTIAISASGIVAFGGAFTNVDGIANADGIVLYDPVANSFSALGTGAAAGAIVEAIVYDQSEILYAGGSFTSMGGVANTVNIASWSGTVWSAMGTGVTAGTDVICLAVHGTDIFAGGNFTGMGGVANTTRLAKWSTLTSAWTALSTGANAAVIALAVSPEGILFIGGSFTALGAISILALGKWNGVTFQALGSANAFTGSTTIRTLKFTPDGTLYMGGENWGAIGGAFFPDNAAIFDGGALVPLSVDLAGTANIMSIAVDNRSGTLYMGFNQAGTAQAELVTTLTHNGNSKSHPVIYMKNNQTSSVRLYSIRNISAGKALYFTYNMAPNEVAVLNTDPENGSFISTFQGDVSRFIMIGSSDFFMKRGDNIIAVFSADDLFIQIYWNQSFSSVAAASGVI